ncbi:MAG: VCBS repeat-containing protein [Deltaproteobacteria bacterium]|nr:VCBS repeat-containing protein [Deltaproteobacteria bacterium]
MKQGKRILLALALSLVFLPGCPRKPSGDPPPPRCGECGPYQVCGPAGTCIPAGNPAADCAEYERWDPAGEYCIYDLPAACTAGAMYLPGAQAFRLAEWGLEGMGVTGQRLGAVDLDDDGRAELVVRKIGDHEAAQASNPDVELVWVLHNTGDASGVSFVDVTEATGLFRRRDGDATRTRPAEIVIFADVNGDGHLDAYTAGGAPNGGAETAELMLGDGALGFTLGAEANPARHAGDEGNPVGATFLDASLDGRVDLFVGTPEQDRFYLGLGTDELPDTTDRQGLLTLPWMDAATVNAGLAHTNSWSTLACDLDGDGYSELLSSSYGRAPNHLWLNQPGEEGSITFANHSVASGYAFDEDLDWTDNQSARCHCQLHPSDEDCAGVPRPTLINCRTDADAFRWNHPTDREPFRLGGNSGTTVCADLNGDGRMDLFTTEIVHWDVGGSSDRSEILVNSGEAPLRFVRPGRGPTGLFRQHSEPDFNEGDMTAAAFDFDNDGRIDLYVGDSDYPGTHGLLYQQYASGVFDEVPVGEGIDQLRSHGMAVADFDRDGDLDIVVGHSSARCYGECYSTFEIRAFENVIGQDGNWLQIELRDPTLPNTRAIGARLELRTASGAQVRQIDGGHGQGGIQHDLVQHFGLGVDCEARLTIHWPEAGSEPQVVHLPAGHRFRITRGEGVELLD